MSPGESRCRATGRQSACNHTRHVCIIAKMVRRILIVDDSRTMLAVLKVYLMGFDYEFETASNAEEALQKAAVCAPDMIISDFQMPRLTGAELCKKARRTRTLRRTPFVMVTANKDEGARNEAFAAGVDGFLTKPIDPKRLVSLVSALFSR